MRKILAATVLAAFAMAMIGCSKGITTPEKTIAMDTAQDIDRIAGGPKKGRSKSDFTAPSEPAGGNKQPPETNK